MPVDDDDNESLDDLAGNPLADAELADAELSENGLSGDDAITGDALKISGAAAAGDTGLRARVWDPSDDDLSDNDPRDSFLTTFFIVFLGLSAFRRR